MRRTARAARSVNYQVGLFLSLSLSQTLLERFSACLRMRIMSPHEVTISACLRMSPHEPIAAATWTALQASNKGRSEAESYV
jgi:hypothetical protein